MKYHTDPKYKIGDIVLIDIKKMIDEEKFYCGDYDNLDLSFERVVQCKVIGAYFIKNGYIGKEGKEITFRHWEYLLEINFYLVHKKVTLSLQENDIIEKI